MQPDYEIIEFKDQPSFRKWLDSHHATANGIWLRMHKKASNLPSITYAEALDEALCYGWIDGQRKTYDDVSFLQKYTPRRPRSLWSKRNIEHIERLTAAGLIMPAGLSEIDKAKSNGRWAAAYDTPSNMELPAQFIKELHNNPKAEQFFATLNKTNTYAIAWRLQTAKTEATYLRRQAKLIAMLNAGEKLY